VRAAIRTLGEGGAGSATLYLADAPVKEHDRDWALMHAVVVAGEATYRWSAETEGQQRA
jgi:hypothetical protein